jgi:transcriptional regulator with XRE-family HTH domain
MTEAHYSKVFIKLGQKIRKLRLDSGMVQEDMLDHGFATRHYQRIEGGLPISVTTAIRLSKVFGVSLADLFKDL